MKDERFKEDDVRHYCDKSQCPNSGNPPGFCETETTCAGGLKRKLPVTPPEVPT